MDVADTTDRARYIGDCAKVIPKYEVGEIIGNGGEMPTRTAIDDP
jgi:hypothetical protein